MYLVFNTFIVMLQLGKVADVFKSGRYKNSVVLYSVVANYNLYRYTTEKYSQITINSLSEFNNYLRRHILVIFIYIQHFHFLIVTCYYLCSDNFCFLKVTYKYPMPPGSWNLMPNCWMLIKLFKRCMVLMGGSIKQIYSSYHYISSGLLIRV